MCVHQSSLHLHSEFVVALREIVGYSKLEVRSNLPNLDVWPQNTNTLLIIEDALSDLNSKAVAKLLTFSSHHNSISCIFTSHGYFTKGANNRVIQANISHLCLLPSPADKLSLSQIERRIFPESKSKVLHRAMQWVETNKRLDEFRYVFCDFSPRSSLPPGYIVKTDILPVNENGEFKVRPIYFLPKDFEPLPKLPRKNQEEDEENSKN